MDDQALRDQIAAASAYEQRQRGATKWPCSTAWEARRPVMQWTTFLERAGVSSIGIATHVGTVRFPSIRTMVEADLRGWLPVLGVMLDETQMARILSEAETLLAPYVSEDGQVGIVAVSGRGRRFCNSSRKRAFSSGEMMMARRPYSIRSRSSDNAGLDNGLCVGLTPRISRSGTCHVKGPDRTRSSASSSVYVVVLRSQSGNPTLRRSTGEKASAWSGDSFTPRATMAAIDPAPAVISTTTSHQSTFDRNVTRATVVSRSNCLRVNTVRQECIGSAAPAADPSTK
jgi:hypothetical protein